MAETSALLHDDLGDRYAIERELGHGATATVYLARDLKFDRLVAVKVLSPDFALAVPTERFLREIRTTARLNHPHIVPLFDSDVTKAKRPYYVMRYIEGETLRDRIARDGPLHIGEALRIARQVAGALGHAHRHGVIHRDIKPGNIMLEDGHTWVADFGIARAISMTDSQVVTNTGVTIGTPAYMSPEQAMGDANLDARTDIYSLGCVLYEMLTGTLPFTGADIQSVMNKHLVEPLPSVRAARPEVPEQVERLLEAALAKKRDDRFTTAAEFAQALSLEGAGPLTPTRTQPVRDRRRGIRWRPRTVIAAAAALAAGVIVVAAWVLTRPTLEPLRYLVAPPFEYGVGASASIDAERLLRDALSQWTGIKVIGRAETDSSGRAGELARRGRAAWYIRGGVSRVGDSLRVRAALYATAGDTLVRERAVNLAPTLAGADLAFANLADRLLFDDTVLAANGGRAGTRSVAARQAFAQGLAKVQGWDLANADSAFRFAAEQDPGYAHAHLWIAQVRFWGGAAPAAWQSSAERAAGGQYPRESRTRSMSDALLAFAREDLPGACAIWERLTRREPHDFAAWHGLGNCLEADHLVVRDPRSISGWRFRASYYQALKAFQQSYRLLPAVHRKLRAGGYASVRRLFMTGGSSVRLGRSTPPESARFNGLRFWSGDSLVVVPFPERDVRGGHPATTAMQNVAALRRLREMFQDVAAAWRAAESRSPSALEAVAVSLEMLGDPSCLDTLRLARSLATTPNEHLDLALAEAWMRLKFALPMDVSGIRAARELIDSVLDQATSDASGHDARVLASLAVVTGRADLAAMISRRVGLEWRAPPPIAGTAPALLVYAALGGPLDSLHSLEQKVQTLITNQMTDPERLAARLEWLGRPATLAFPDYRFAAIIDLADAGDYLINAQAALLRGDTLAARQILQTVKTHTRRWLPPETLTLDALYPETRVLVAIGDTAAAIEWLDPALHALAATAPGIFTDPARAGALVRAMALRAELAHRMGDSDSAVRWARAVVILWSDADEFLQPVVQRMQQLTRRE